MIDRSLAEEIRPRKGQLAAVAAMTTLAALLTVTQAWFLAVCIDGAFLAGQGVEELTRPLAAFLAALAGRSLALWLQERLAVGLALEVKQAMRERIAERWIQAGPLRLGRVKPGEMLATAMDGVEALEPYFARYLPQLAAAVLVPALVLAVVTGLDRTSAVLLAVTAPLIPLFMWLIGRLAEAKNRRQWGVLTRLQGHFLDVIKGLETLKLFGRSGDQERTIARVSEEFRRATMEVVRVAFLSALTLEFFATIGTAVVAVTVGLRLLYGQMEFREAFFVLLLAPEFYLPLRSLGSHFHAGMAGTAAMAEIRKATEQLESAGSGLAEAAEPFAAREVAVQLQGVTVCYDSAREPALREVSFLLPAGQVTAIVGPSGAGKSTVAQLLLRFVSFQSGRVMVNDRDLLSIPLADWRRHIAYVPQRTSLFRATVAQNIALGKPDAERADVEAAARAANADGFIRALPQGYDTLIGSGGQGLSGGEEQRISLARAFLSDAPLVVVDEPTAGLDPTSEALVAEALYRLLQGRTGVIIAHRLSTVLQAQQVLVLANGEVCESGNPADLLRRESHFYKLCRHYRGES